MEIPGEADNNIKEEDGVAEWGNGYRAKGFSGTVIVERSIDMPGYEEVI